VLSLCYIHTLSVSFPWSTEGFPLQVFIPVTFTTTCVVPAVLFSDAYIGLFYLLTYLVTCCIMYVCILLKDAVMTFSKQVKSASWPFMVIPGH